MHSAIPPPYLQVMPSHSGLHRAQSGLCHTLSFATLNLAAGQTHSGHTGERECFLLALSGSAHVTVNDQPYPCIGQRPDVFSGTPHGLYLPRGSVYTITACTSFRAALPSALSDLDTAPYEVHSTNPGTHRGGLPSANRWHHELLGSPEFGPTSRLSVVEIHTSRRPFRAPLPTADQFMRGDMQLGEQLTYFRFSAKSGRGLARHHSTQHGYDDLYSLVDHSLLTLPHGECTYSLEPGVGATTLWAFTRVPVIPPRRIFKRHQESL
jgi:5-deoxy-glucuronate isomerase